MHEHAVILTFFSSTNSYWRQSTKLTIHIQPKSRPNSESTDQSTIGKHLKRVCICSSGYLWHTLLACCWLLDGLAIHFVGMRALQLTKKKKKQKCMHVLYVIEIQVPQIADRVRMKCAFFCVCARAINAICVHKLNACIFCTIVEHKKLTLPLLLLLLFVLAYVIVNLSIIKKILSLQDWKRNHCISQVGRQHGKQAVTYAHSEKVFFFLVLMSGKRIKELPATTGSACCSLNKTKRKKEKNFNKKRIFNCLYFH